MISRSVGTLSLMRRRNVGGIGMSHWSSRICATTPFRARSAKTKTSASFIGENVGEMASPAGQIRLDRVAVRYASFTAVEEISFEVPAGQFVAIVGPTGSGKSSLLNVVAGL